MLVSEHLKKQSIQGIETLARASYVAKAIFYGTIALFTLQFALGSRDVNPNQKEVLYHLMGHPLGKVLLALMTIALAGHTLWRLVETWNDPYQKGTGPGGLIYRLNYLLSAVTYGSLGVTALHLLLGGGRGVPNQKQLWVAQLLNIEGGRGLIIAVGCILLTWAGLQIYKGVSSRVYKNLDLAKIPWLGRSFLQSCSWVGFSTVGGTLGGTGWVLIKGAWTKDPHWVKNMDDLIKALAGLPGGWWLQVGVAMGFLLMAVFMLAMARYFPLKATE